MCIRPYENYKAINYEHDKLSRPREAIIERSVYANPGELLVNLNQVRNTVGCWVQRAAHQPYNNGWLEC